VSIYQLTTEGRDAALRKHKKQALIMGFSLALIGSTLVTIFQQSDEPLPPGIYACTFIGFFIALFGATQIGGRIGRNGLKSEWDHYELRLDDNALTVQRAQKSNLTILRAQVSRLQRTPSGDLLIRGSSAQEVTIIPSSMDGFDEIVQALDEWHPIENSMQAHIRNNLPAIIGLTILTISVRSFENPWIVLPLGLLMLIGFGYLTITTLRNSSVSQKGKVGTLAVGGLMTALQMSLVVLRLTRPVP
jgi:hypothetical protein